MIPLLKALAVVEHYMPAFDGVLRGEERQQMKRYLSGLIINENKTIEGINKLFVLTPQDQCTLNRFLTDSHFDLSALNEARLDWLQSCAQMAFREGPAAKGVLVVDDTLLTHYGSHFEKIAWLYDHVRNAYTWAHCLVNLHYSDDETDYPIDFRFWEPGQEEEMERALREMGCGFSERCLHYKEEDPPRWKRYLLKKYNKRKAKPLRETQMEIVYKTKIDWARELLDAFFKRYPQSNLPVAFDGWYTCLELCTHIDGVLHKSYVGTLAADNVVLVGPAAKEVRLDQFTQDLIKQHQQALLQGKKPLFEKVGIHYKGAKEVYYAYCRTHNIKNFGRQRLVISFTEEKLTDAEPNYYISNRLHWRSGGILRIRRHRWPIEVYHEEAKAEGLDQYQLRHFEGVKKHIACVCLAYSMLKRVQFDPEFLHQLHWEPEKKNGSLAFWRRVMTANALLAFLSWALEPLGNTPDWTPIIQAVAKAYLW